MVGKLSQKQSEANREDTVVLQFLGDISLNGLFCDPQYYEELTENMSKLSTELGICDLRLGNWEAPLWGGRGFNILKVPCVCTTEDTAKCVLPLNLDVALLASNHIYDCLENGFENTVRFLEMSGISHLGAGASQEQARKP